VLLLFALCLAALAGDLRVLVLDVGQGDAILLEAANGKRVLVDAGTRRAEVVQLLKARGVKSLDMVVATHAHADHIGGMVSVLKTYKPKIYLDNSMAHTTLTYSSTMAALERHDIGYRTAVYGRTFRLDEDVSMTVLHPRSRLLRDTRSDLNSNSVVIRIDHGEDCILLTGDAEDATERALMQQQIAPCGVLKVAHHGSGHSTSAAWLRAIAPKIALISVGRDNRYGHPDPDTLARLKAADVKVHRTDLEGTLTLVSTGTGVRVESLRNLTDILTEHKTLDRPPVLQAETVNINQADLNSLDQLPGIGPARAAAIIADREANGPYTQCSELQRIKGIGPKTVAGLESNCTTQPPAENP